MKTLISDPLRSFAEVVRLGSFSSAAARLGLTQPAISVQIRNLEAHVGAQLIERTGRNAFPTTAGQELLAFAQRVSEEERIVMARMKGHAEGKFGTVRLGTGATTCIYRLLPILAELRSTYPGFEITIVTGNARELLDAVEAHSLDMAIVTVFGPTRQLTMRPLCSDSMVAILPASHSKQMTTIAPGKLPDLPLILYDKGDPIRAVIDSWFLSGKMNVQPDMEIGSIEAIKNIVAAGLGYSIVPLISVNNSSDRENLRIVPLSPQLRRRLGVAIRRDAETDQAARAMVTALATMKDC